MPRVVCSRGVAQGGELGPFLFIEGKGQLFSLNGMATRGLNRKRRLLEWVVLWG